MVWNCTDKIIYYPREFGIYDPESLRVVECVYAYNFMVNSGLNDPNKAFLIKTGRSANEPELEYIDRIKNGEKAPHGVYNHNWIVYSAQNVSLKYPGLTPSTKSVKEISEKTFGHKISYEVLNSIIALSKKRIYMLQKGYYGVNVWQPIEVCCALDSIGLNRSQESISLLFNKIYRRDPKLEELTICKSLKITNYQEIKDEIEQIIDVRIKKPVSFKRISKRTRP